MLDRRIEFRQRFSSDHGLEIRHERARLDQKFNAGLNRGDGYGLGLGETVAPDGHQPGYGSSGGRAAYCETSHALTLPRI